MGLHLLVLGEGDPHARLRAPPQLPGVLRSPKGRRSGVLPLRGSPLVGDLKDRSGPGTAEKGQEDRLKAATVESPRYSPECVEKLFGKCLEGVLLGVPVARSARIGGSFVCAWGLSEPDSAPIPIFQTVSEGAFPELRAEGFSEARPIAYGFAGVSAPSVFGLRPAAVVKCPWARRPVSSPSWAAGPSRVLARSLGVGTARGANGDGARVF